VVVAFRYVIGSLFVVRIGAVFEQQAGQLRMTRDASRAVDRALPYGPRIGMIDHLDPASVRGGSGLEQGTSRSDEGRRPRLIQPQITREAQIGQGIPIA